jgi:hypothetical protein
MHVLSVTVVYCSVVVKCCRRCCQGNFSFGGISRLNWEPPERMRGWNIQELETGPNVTRRMETQPLLRPVTEKREGDQSKEKRPPKLKDCTISFFFFK